jgi:D-alanyl-D-alanine dipeptidase
MHAAQCRLDDSGKGVKAVTTATAAATAAPVLGAGRTVASTSSVSLAADARVVLKYTTVADGTNQPRYTYTILCCTNTTKVYVSEYLPSLRHRVSLR